MLVRCFWATSALSGSGRGSRQRLGQETRGMFSSAGGGLIEPAAERRGHSSGVTSEPLGCVHLEGVKQRGAIQPGLLGGSVQPSASWGSDCSRPFALGAATKFLSPAGLRVQLVREEVPAALSPQQNRGVVGRALQVFLPSCFEFVKRNERERRVFGLMKKIPVFFFVALIDK